MLNDTIAAIATPLGEGGLAVIRVSGPGALAVLDRCFTPTGQAAPKPSQCPSHTIHYGHIVRAGKVIDEVLLSLMRAPRTFTCEDTAEISCHGGLLPAKLVLDTVLEAGARLAHPGEFTRRAFLNGRIDLAQAEAVSDVIHSRTELALAAANEQLAGKLSQRINQLRDALMKTLAHVEAHIDFPDEDIAPDTRQQLVDRLDQGIAFMEELLRTAGEGQLLRRGIRAVIVGRPNTGKSSLLNQLLGRDRAIVSPVPGTTRDTIEETANIRGIPVVFVDTAGLREAEDVIEAEGVRRSHAALEQAELVLHVLDNSEPLAPVEAQSLRAWSNRKRIIVKNKIDLPPRLELPEEFTFRADAHSFSPLGGEGQDEGAAPAKQTAPILEVSCLDSRGLEALKDAIKQMVWAGEIKSEMLQVMINSRHQDALRRARDAASQARDALRQEVSLELAALDLRAAANAVGEVVGKTATEDLLDAIFSQFCIGK